MSSTGYASMAHTIHLISQVQPSSQGGLELWTARFARHLSKIGLRVVVYVCSDLSVLATDECEFEVVHLAPLRSVWEEPIDMPVWTERFAQERARLNFLILRNELQRRILRQQAAEHLVISNFSVTAGYLAALVARDLALPHIAMVVGSDFSRGFRNSRERPAIEYTCKTAAAVVVKNEEQARALTGEYGLDRVCCIPTSIEIPATIRQQPNARTRITLFSDCGFSFKKGTGVLLDGFQTLISEGFPLRLVIYGGIARDQLAYWKMRQEQFTGTMSPHVEFPGNVSRKAIYAALNAADVYCSATLGEGSSSGRIAALCAGLPIVTTKCGEMESGMDNVSHVMLASPADAAAFKEKLRIMVQELLNGTLRIDRDVIDNWRERYAPERELSDWVALINSVVGNR